eukprot:m.41454 g.41454  ORF g.41454 m.41454 type:complete len:286 (-) comp10558_c0_seq2:1350-2207(-)
MALGDPNFIPAPSSIPGAHPSPHHYPQAVPQTTPQPQLPSFTLTRNALHQNDPLVTRIFFRSETRDAWITRAKALLTREEAQASSFTSRSSEISVSGPQSAIETIHRDLTSYIGGELTARCRKVAISLSAEERDAMHAHTEAHKAFVSAEFDFCFIKEVDAASAQEQGIVLQRSVFQHQNTPDNSFIAYDSQTNVKLNEAYAQFQQTGQDPQLIQRVDGDYEWVYFNAGFVNLVPATAHDQVKAKFHFRILPTATTLVLHGIDYCTTPESELKLRQHFITLQSQF